MKAATRNNPRIRLTHLGDGAPLVFLHGWGLAPAAYHTSLALLADRGHRILAPALPGFGGSAALSLRHQDCSGVAHAIADTLDTLDLPGPVPVVGHSFGGGVATTLAALRPDLVSLVIGICPVGGAGAGRARVDRMATSLALDSIRPWLPRAVSILGPNLAHHPLAVIASAYHAWSADTAQALWRAANHGIEIDLHFADGDAVVVPGPLADLTIPGVRIENGPGRHSWLLTDPTRFADLVSRRLASTGSASSPVNAAAA